MCASFAHRDRRALHRPWNCVSLRKRLLGNKGDPNGAVLCAAPSGPPAPGAPDPCARISHAHQRRPPERHPSDQRARTELCSPHHNMAHGRTIH
eukprot:1980229-Prymnesium_polylepis.1